MTANELSDIARTATERANLAQERLEAIAFVRRAYALLYTAYEGNENVLNEIYEMRESFRQWANERRDKLHAIMAQEREKAARAVEKLSEGDYEKMR